MEKSNGRRRINVALQDATEVPLPTTPLRTIVLDVKLAQPFLPVDDDQVSTATGIHTKVHV